MVCPRLPKKYKQKRSSNVLREPRLDELLLAVWSQRAVYEVVSRVMQRFRLTGLEGFGRNTNIGCCEDSFGRQRNAPEFS